MSPVAVPQDPILSWIRDQDEALAILRSAVREDRVAQAYLFHGPRGVGKTRSALGVAQALECVSPGPDGACGACLPCRKVAGLAHPDVRLVFPMTREEEKDLDETSRRLDDYAANRYALLDFARNASIGIGRIRELKGEAAKSLAEGRRRVFILCDAGRMLEEAAQSALKLIEEPPPDTHLILVAEEPAALLPTIVSRCQHVRFRPLRRGPIEEILAAMGESSSTEARLASSLANGSLGRAIALIEEGSIVKIRDEAVDLLDPVRDAGAVQERVRQWAGRLNANSSRRMAEILLAWCHDLTAVKFGLPPDALSNPDRVEDLVRQAGALDLPAIREKIEALEEMCDSIDRNVNPLLSLHEALLRLCSSVPGPRRMEV